MEEQTQAVIGIKQEIDDNQTNQSGTKLDLRDFLYNLAQKGVNSEVLEDEEDESLKKSNKSERIASNIQEFHDPLNYEAGLVERKLSLEEENNDITKGNKKLESIKTEKYKYIGYTLNGLRDGFGVCYYANGGVHIGEFKKGKKQGYGKTIFANGEIMLGELQNNFYEGFCELSITKDNISVIGICSKGKYIGEIVIKKDKKSIEGIDLANLPNYALCRINYSANNYFIGEIDCSDPKFETGFGIIVNKRSYVYMGNFKDGKFNGYGEFYKANGSRYYGNYNNHLKQGIGFYYNKEFIGFGNFKDNLKHGPFYLIRKNIIRVELYFLGLSSKIIEKIDTIKKYINLYYPEYKYVLHPNLAGLLNKLSSVNDNQEILAELIVEKVKKEDSKTEESVKENSNNNVEVQK